jgi:hypothetical protein
VGGIAEKIGIPLDKQGVPFTGMDQSIPVGDPSERGSAGRTRLFGQGPRGAFRNFTTSTMSGPGSASEIASALTGALRDLGRGGCSSGDGDLVGARARGRM